MRSCDCWSRARSLCHSLWSASSALPFPGRGGVEMADGDGEGIGGVGGFGDLIQVEKARDHLLDLMLFSTTVSDHGRLNGEWGVFGDFESGGGCGQHGYSAHLAEFQGGLHIGGVEDVFDGDSFGAMPGDELLQTDGDSRQARGHGIARRNFDGAADDADETIISVVIGEQIHYAVPGVFGAAVDAEDAHGGSVAGEQFSVLSSQFPVPSSQFLVSTASWPSQFGLLVLPPENCVGVR
jgi:hypothetical protein